MYKVNFDVTETENLEELASDRGVKIEINEEVEPINVVATAEDIEALKLYVNDVFESDGDKEQIEFINSTIEEVEDESAIAA